MDDHQASVIQQTKAVPIKSHLTHLPARCFKCKQVIVEAHLLLADEQYWHEDCLRCVCCEVRLAELDKVFYVKADMPLCRRDYLRLYGQTGECFVCHKRILAFEFVMRIQNKVYHLNCFSCQQCQLRFCVGDKFYLHNQSILCEQDYAFIVLASIQPRLLVPTTTINGVFRGRPMLPSLFNLNANQTHMWPTILLKDSMSATPMNSSPVARSDPTGSSARPSPAGDDLLSPALIGYSRLPTTKSPVTNGLKMDTINSELNDAEGHASDLTGSGQSWYSGPSRDVFHGVIKQPCICDDHSSGYGSPSPTLSAHLEQRCPENCAPCER